MQEITAFMASDKTLFPTAAECEDYEYALKWRTKIEACIASPGFPYKSGAQRGMVFKIITAWERYKTHLMGTPVA